VRRNLPFGMVAGIMLAPVSLWVHLETIGRAQVVPHGTDEEAELENLLSRTGRPYNDGWVEVEPEHGQKTRYVSYDVVKMVTLEP
jgi:hypothetical protein